MKCLAKNQKKNVCNEFTTHIVRQALLVFLRINYVFWVLINVLLQKHVSVVFTIDIKDCFNQQCSVFVLIPSYDYDAHIA